MREILDPEIFKYCEQHSTQVDDTLRQLERQTFLSTVAPQMIAGAYQGKFLEIICRLKSPQRALEIGTFTGYGAVSIARGLPEDGRLDTIEINPERQSIIEDHFRQTGTAARINLMIGNAIEIIPALKHVYQFIFIDAAKRDNSTYVDLCLPLLESGGVMILDNVFWGGKVVTDPEDSEASAIDALNKRLANDPSLETIMLPIRDGVTVVIKK